MQHDREQLIQEITQAPDDLVQTVLEFLLQAKAIRAERILDQTALAFFVGALQNSPIFQDDPVIIQRQMRDEWL